MQPRARRSSPSTRKRTSCSPMPTRGLLRRSAEFPAQNSNRRSSLRCIRCTRRQATRCRKDRARDSARPLAVVMAEQVAALRAAGRTARCARLRRYQSRLREIGDSHDHRPAITGQLSKEAPPTLPWAPVDLTLIKQRTRRARPSLNSAEQVHPRRDDRTRRPGCGSANTLHRDSDCATHPRSSRPGSWTCDLENVSNKMITRKLSSGYRT